MKKLIAIAVVFALIAGTAFAADGVTINAWGRALVTPFAWVGKAKNADEVVAGSVDNYYTGKGVTWGNQARVDFRIVGSSQFVGFGVNATAEDNSLAGNDDAAYIWAKPLGGDYANLLTIKVGKFTDHSLRGKSFNANNTFYNPVLPRFSSTVPAGLPALRDPWAYGDTEPEDRVFNRFVTGTQGHLNSTYIKNTDGGFMLSSVPIDGLFVGLMVNGNGRWWSSDHTTIQQAYRYAQIGVGYKLPEIGHVRAQWIGGYAGKYTADDIANVQEYGWETFSATSPGRVEAAFDLTAIQGLRLDLGGKFWMPIQANGSYASNGIDLAIETDFRAEALRFALSASLNIGAFTRSGGDEKSTRGEVLDLRFAPSYDLDFATVGLLFAMNLQTQGLDADGKDIDDGKAISRLGFGGYIQKSLGKGSFKAGLTCTLPYNYDGKSYGSASFGIPVLIEYAFF